MRQSVGRSRSWWLLAVIVSTFSWSMGACRSTSRSESDESAAVPSVTLAGDTTPRATSAAPVTAPVSISPTSVASASPLVESPEGIAAAILAAERGIRDSALPAPEIEMWGRRQQRAYRLLANHPEWDEQVQDLLPSDVATPFAMNVEARRAVAEHAAANAAAASTPPTPPPDTLPAWTIVAPLPVAQLLGEYRQAQAATGVPWQYLAAINVVETRTGRIVGKSSSGALGPMQFLPSTWASCCTGNILDAHDAIMGAAKYLVSRGAPADMRAALFGYNPNDGYVGAVDAYARNMIADERAFNGYHAWEVYITTSAGTVRLPVGYRADQPEIASAYASANPQDVAPIRE